MRRKYDFFAERANFGRRIDISMALHLPSGIQYGDEGAPLMRSVATGINFTEVDPFAPHFHEPLLKLIPAEAQSLMDELWQAGVRPANGVGSVGQLAATEAHLADMRKISFDLLAKVQP